MKQIYFYFLFALCVFATGGVASSLMTPENAVMGGIARAMRMYQIVNQGRLPSNWAQLRQVYNLDEVNRVLEGRQSYPIEDHYQFITQPLSLPYPVDGRVLMIRTVPLENLLEPDPAKRQQWRYLIYQNKKGDILSTRISEKDVQNMINSAGVRITPKAGLPAVETDERIPGTELTPQPNPADAPFLAQHPELDPSRKAPFLAPSFSATPLPSSTPQHSPAKTEQLVVKEGPSLRLGWLYIFVVVVLAGVGCIWHCIRKR